MLQFNLTTRHLFGTFPLLLNKLLGFLRISFDDTSVVLWWLRLSGVLSADYRWLLLLYAPEI